MKKKKKLAKLTPFLIGTCLFTLVSCGSDDDDSSSAAAPTPQAEEERQAEGIYQVNLQPLNSDVAGNIDTTATITVMGDTIQFESSGTGLTSTVHAQHITAAAACPTMAEDANGDGFIDVVEGIPAYGQILLPLDNNLTDLSQNIFPRGSSFNYSESASLNALLTALQAPDTTPDDPFTTLGPDGNLDLEGRTVVIHGVSQSANLPDSVASVDGFPNTLTLPIACGTITRGPAPAPEPETEPTPAPEGQQPVPTPTPTPEGEEGETTPVPPLPEDQQGDEPLPQQPLPEDIEA